MFEGFVRVAAVTPEIRVADCTHNLEKIDACIQTAAAAGARIICLPELCITGYTCGELFLQDTLLREAKEALVQLIRRSAGRKETVIVGLPFALGDKLYNVAAVYSGGRLIALAPKRFIPNYGEFYEARHFTSADPLDRRDSVMLQVASGGEPALFAPFGLNHVLTYQPDPGLTFGVEICEDLWAPTPPSIALAQAGARIIFNLSASNETIGKAAYRRELVRGQSARLLCAYIYADAGFGESTTDMIFSGHNIIAENGKILAESTPFCDGMAIADIDVTGISHDRRYMTTWLAGGGNARENILHIPFPAGTTFAADPENACGRGTTFAADPENACGRGTEDMSGSCGISGMNGTTEMSGICGTSGMNETTEISGMNGMSGKNGLAEEGPAQDDYLRSEDLLRHVDPHPFVPADETERDARCDEILHMQSSGLAKRLLHTNAGTAVIGISGGLDSTLALLVTVRAMERIGKDGRGITAVTMPAFGTSERTRSNALQLCKALQVPLREIDITESATEHLRTIEHPLSNQNVVFENAQARVRTLVLMDLSNKLRGLVVGTGDLSELALGWATYNGDHMSMYGVNAGVPKTLVRHIIRYVAETNPHLRQVLTDILDTPVSPELLPPDENGISQKTEEIIGPYELHDFFLYHMIRWGRSPSLILQLATKAFSGCYEKETIHSWIKVFYRRFFASQFKRSALPDGPKIGTVSLSPRGDWRMPSDAAVRCWLKELE